MKYSVSMTSRAEQDRQRAFEWYAANYSVEFATRWFNGITRAMRSLANKPQRYSKAPESAFYTFDLLELLYGRRKTKHRVLFRIHKDLVLVLRIRHAAQGDLTEGEI